MRHPCRRSLGVLISLFLFLLLLPAALAAAEPTRATLANGMRVIIIPNRLSPVATVMVNYLVGTTQDPEDYTGMAHATEHMMFRGTPGLSAAQLATVMADLGGEFNADTGQTVTQYFSTVPVEELEVALRVEAVRMKEMLPREKFEQLWQKERGAIIQEVEMRVSSPMYLFQQRLLQQMYAGTPFARTGLGTRDAFLRITGEMLQKFHQTWYAPNNAILIITGDVEPQSVLPVVKSIFEGISAEKLPARAPVRLQPLAPAAFAMETDEPTGLAVTAYRLPGYDDPDYAAGMVLADVLASQRGEIYALVPAGEALDADFSLIPNPPASVGLATASFPKNGPGKELVGKLQRIIAQYREKGVPEDLVTAAKRHAVADAQFQKNAIMGQAMLWSEAVAVEKRLSPDELVKAINRVTVADVNRVARRWLVNKTATTAVLTPRAAGRPHAAVETPGPGVKSYTPQEVEPGVSLPAWAEKARTANVPRLTVEPADLRLANGLRLIVLPLEISPTVSLYGRVDNNPNLQVPPGKEGVDEILSDLFPYGTGKLDRLAFQRKVDEIGARLAVGTDFSLQVLEDQFERGVELLAANLLDPALPEKAFATLREQEAAALPGELESPNFLTRQALRNALFPKGDPSLRHATPKSVQGLTLADVKAYHRAVFRPDMTTIVVVGRISPEQARAVIEKHFGSWRAHGPKPDTHYPAVPPSRATAMRVPDPSRVQDLVMLAGTVDITRRSPDYYPLELGQHVLAGGFYATRLYRDLREKTGLVYTVDADIDAGWNRAILHVVYGCEPDAVTHAQAIVVRDLQAMQREPVSEDDLRQARTLLLRQIPLTRASVDGTAGKWLDLVRLGLPLDEPQIAARRYMSITAQDIQDAFARHIRPDELARIIQGPAPK
ncbi:MAG: pitrilysin family protein [Desulfobacteraceae bacterium]|nr:pitrilysin family protein [Desulfobacteraceae bacterium]